MAQRLRFSEESGPWTHVNDAQDPGETRLSTLYDATDIWLPDPQRGSGAYQRPGISELFTTQAGTGGGSPDRYGHGAYDHTDLDGTIRRFFFIGTKVYRWDGIVSGGAALTDVTPVGVAIQSGFRVFCNSLAGKLVAHDGFNRPWVGTNLGATPITGTYIDYDGAGSSWKATGPITLFGGSVAFAAYQLGGVYTTDTILWSAPADPTVGYKQTNYANYWELFQTSTNRIYAVIGTNDRFYYFRANSIGAITGPTLNVAKAAATHDNVSTTVGTTSPGTVLLAGNTIFFADIQGRPHRLPVGGVPEDLSWQMRRTMAASTLNVTTLDAAYSGAWASWVPDLHMVAFAPWNTYGSTIQKMFMFSDKTGGYVGQWDVSGYSFQSQPATLDVGAVMRDDAGNRLFLLLGNNGNGTYAAANAGYIYTQQLYAGIYPATNAIKWGRTGSGGPGTVTTHALGYDDDWDKSFDTVVAAVSSSTHGNDQTWKLSYLTSRTDWGSLLSAVASAVYGATDGIARAIWGIFGSGRYIRVKVTLAAGLDAGGTSIGQRSVHAVRVEGVRRGSLTGAP